MIGLLWPMLGILAGAFLAIQAPINTTLAKSLGLTAAAAASSFLAGAAVLLLLSFALARAEGISIAWSAPPLWMLLAGGLLGAAYVTSIIVLTPRLGTAATMAFIVTGQLLGGLLLDKFGYLGFAVRELTLGRVTGACLLLAGALLIRFT